MYNMTEAQKKFVALEKKKSEYKAWMEELTNAIAEVAKESGVNSYFQDEHGTVYKIVVPDGKFVYFDKVSYVRTRRGDEKRGDLSLKEAQEAGFKLDG